MRKRWMFCVSQRVEKWVLLVVELLVLVVKRLVVELLVLGVERLVVEQLVLGVERLVVERLVVELLVLVVERRSVERVLGVERVHFVGQVRKLRVRQEGGAAGSDGPGRGHQNPQLSLFQPTSHRTTPSQSILS